MMDLTFDKLPQAVAQLIDDVGIIKQLLIQKGNDPQVGGDQLLTIQEAAHDTSSFRTDSLWFGSSQRSSRMQKKVQAPFYFSKR